MSTYNIVSLGDHCAAPLVLKNLGLRTCSYPFDWISNAEQVHDTNIMHNIQIIKELKEGKKEIKLIVDEFLGDALTSDKKINSRTNIWFPHDPEPITEVHAKYERRFLRLIEDLKSKKNLFILVTRHYSIAATVFDEILETLMSFNPENRILFISGTDHAYLRQEKYTNIVRFEYIHYDIKQFYAYDYSVFRPKITNLFRALFANKT